MAVMNIGNKAITKIAEVSEQIGLETDQEKLVNFLALCDVAESLGDDLGEYSAGFMLDPNPPYAGSVFVDTPDAFFESGKPHPFFNHMDKSDEFSFAKSEEGLRRIILTVIGLWKKPAQ